MLNWSTEGKTALVCGSSRGLGLGAAKALAEMGARVVLHGRDAEQLERVAGDLPAGRAAGTVIADFTHPDEVQRMAQQIIRDFGGVHILVNNSGGPAPGPALQALVTEYATALTQHLLAFQVLVQAMVPFMKTARYGRIINIISSSVKQVIPGLGVSNTVRWAVAGWAKTLAGELGPFGITVNNVLPGYIRTRRLEALIAHRAEVKGVPPGEMEAEMLRDIPAGAFGKVEDIGAAVAFLASPAAGYINGVNLPVDGGRLKCL